MATGFTTGLWEVRECASSKAKFICQQNQDTSVSPQPSAPPAPPAPQPTPSLNGSCPNNWKSNNNLRYCYKVRLHTISCISTPKHHLKHRPACLRLACAGISFPPAGSEAQLAAGTPLLPETWSQPAEHHRPRGGAVCPEGPPRGFWVGLSIFVILYELRMRMVVMETMMWPAGSQRSMSSTGFGSD